MKRFVVGMLWLDPMMNFSWAFTFIVNELGKLIRYIPNGDVHVDLSDCDIYPTAEIFIVYW